MAVSIAGPITNGPADDGTQIANLSFFAASKHMSFPILQARTAQVQAFSPKLQQAVRLLQMSSADFTRALLDEAALNPFLDVEPVSDDSDADEANEALTHADETWAAESESYEGLSPRDRPVGDAGLDALQGVALPTTLKAHLTMQLGVLRLSDRDRALATAVIEGLDDDGYLRVSTDDLAQLFGESDPGIAADLQRAIARVQSFEPTGVCARTVAECLQLQLGDLPCDPIRELAWRALDEHIELIAHRQLARLAVELDASMASVRAATDMIRALDPHPARHFDQRMSPAVRPDVTVVKVKGRWVTRLNASAVPSVQLNQACAGLMGKEVHAANSEMSQCLTHATWVVNNVAQRLSTILEIARAIVERQQLFLEYGMLAMKPLGLREIADVVGVHPSTVSRAVHDKYLATPHGLYEMRRFFSRGMAHSTGASSAPAAVKGLVRALIQAEAAEAPVSDAELARQLAQQGLRIARRTVTKYRQGLGIDAVEQRRSAAWERTSVSSSPTA